MVRIEGEDGVSYEFLNQIDVQEHVEVWEVVEQPAQIPRIVYWAQSPSLPLGIQTRWKNELAISQLLPDKGFRKAVRFVSLDKRQALLLEKPQGAALHSTQLAQWPLDQTLRVAARVASQLDVIHKQGVIYNGLRPENLVFDPSTGEVVLADFGNAGMVSLESERSYHALSGQFSFRYTSPEQTGRLNRKIDLRSDLYIFGVLLFEWLAGKYPFPDQDHLALVHHHLAMAPPSMQRYRPDLPLALDHIVLKLMAKNPEDRYHSAAGVARDLEACLESLLLHGSIGYFQPGQEDYSGILRIPEKLYGRETQIARIEELFLQVCKHEQAALFISGQAGIGKSTLMDNLRLSVFQARGVFIQGKFEKFQHHSPYSALMQALKEAVAFLLAQPEDFLGDYRMELLDQVGQNGALLTGFLPELKGITGSFPLADELHGIEAENRLNHLFRIFVKSIVVKAGPLVIFLDDLQWADTATLRFLDLLFSGTPIPGLFIVGAYRENEIGSYHPLAQLYKELESKGITVHQMALGPFDQGVVCALLKDTLGRTETALHELARLVFVKTEGNPFFIHQFLRDLQKQGLIRFDLNRKRWDFDLAEISRSGVQENAVEFMVKKILELPDAAQELLLQAACVGTRFKLSVLASLSQKMIPWTLRHLLPAIEVGLVIPLDANFEILRYMEEEAGAFPEVRFKFVHDRVQEAAYSMVNREEQSLLHYRVAQILSREYSAESGSSSDLFSMVNHYNQALSFVWMEEERERLFKLNREAGLLAFHSGAFTSAYSYLSQAMRLAPSDHWERSYEEAYSFSLACAESAFLSGEFNVAESLIEEAGKRAKSVIDECRPASLQMSLLVHSGDFGRIPDLLFPVLAKLGVHMPSRPKALHLLWEFFRVGRLERKYSVTSLLERPPMQDPRMVLALDILSNASVFAHSFTQELWGMTMLRTVSLCLQHGYHKGVVMSLGAYGAMRALLFQDYDGMERLVVLGKAIADQNPGPFTLSRAYLTSGGTVTYFKDHLFQGVYNWEKCIQTAIAGGDPSFACLVTPLLALRLISTGYTLEAAEPKAREMVALSVQYKELDMGMSVSLIHQSLAALMGKMPVRFRHEGKELDERGLFDAMKRSKNRTGFVLGSAGWIQAACHQEQYDLAFEIAQALAANQSAMGGTDATFEFHFWRPIICCIRYARKEGKERILLKRQARSSIRQLEKWAKISSQNFGYRLWLAKAEWARALGRVEEALDRYQKSLRGAEEIGLANIAGFIHLRMASLFQAMDFIPHAGLHAQSAIEEYQRWGAETIVNRIRSVYPQTAELREPARPFDKGQLAQALDLNTVLKATQAISSEIILEKLEERLLQIAMENAGAQRGVFIVQDQESWLIKAYASVDQPSALIQDQPLLGSDLAPERLVEYAARSRQVLLLDQAFTDNRFQHDPYLQKQKTRSVLCLPIIKQNVTTGVLYLENNLVFGAFNEDHIQLLKVLSAQMGISMENATLYRNLVEALDQQKKLAEAYSRFTPREFLQFLGKNSILEVGLGDQRYGIMSVLVSDIRGYTTLTESMSPEENFNFVNAYFQRMTPIIGQHNGVVNQFLGDGIIAVFNQPDDALQACLGMSRSLEEYNLNLEKKLKAPIKVGIGVHTGPLMLGIIGDQHRMDTSIISDTVNSASRLEGLTKFYFADLIISGQTLRELKTPDSFDFRYLGKVQVKGKTEAMDIYEVFTGNAPSQRQFKQQTKRDFERGLLLYAQRHFSEAEEAFRNILQINPDDRTALVFLERTSTLRRDGVPPDWSSIERMTLK
ncbi:MAG: AAA family ATPase [Haliscomenobacter sp.]|nr:AAA family ATPase [Haliscomenobacter sp.]